MIWRKKLLILGASVGVELMKAILDGRAHLARPLGGPELGEKRAHS
jgi:hypothetical protein